MKTLFQGAEATIYLDKDKILKSRLPKKYRHPDLDEKLRVRRTKSEIKLLTKASSFVPVPQLLESSEDNYTIKMSYIKGKKLSLYLEKLKNYQKICKTIGASLAKLHDAGIIHGDLTTSNLILAGKDKKIYFIDFGLGFHSSRTEDKAVDLHLIKEALHAKHPKIAGKAFKEILKGYRSSANYLAVTKRLERVEKRGRYKAQY